jgi:hypothetical protein
VAFASTQDVADRLGRDLTAGEETSVDLLIELVTGVIAEAAGEDDAWAAALSPVPVVIKAVTVEVVCRGLANPNSLESLQETLGQHNYSARFREAGLWLTDHEERLVRRAAGTSMSGSALVKSIVGNQEAVNEDLE